MASWVTPCPTLTARSWTTRACSFPAIVGDGEAETGPLATGWQSNKLVNPRTDGIVLPILHLNGYKIANPTILSRISDEELHEFFHGMGYEPYEFVAGFDDEDHMSIHRRFAELFESVWDEICDIKAAAQTRTTCTVRSTR